MTQNLNSPAIYDGPLTAAELAEYNAQRAQSAQIPPEWATHQPMAAEACTDCDADRRGRRTWPRLIVAPVYFMLVVVFFTVGWVIFALPSGETAKTLALLIGAPLVLIAVIALVARWLV